jgi:hypothetical protein
MKKALFAAAAFAFVLSAGHFAVAADDAKMKTEKMTGVFIDEHCGEKMEAKGADAQKSAEGHDKACCLKCAKDGGLEFMSGGKMMKLDKDSEKKAMDFLAEEKNGTKATITAMKNDDGSLMIHDIKAAKGKKKADAAAEGEKKEEKKD